MPLFVKMASSCKKALSAAENKVRSLKKADIVKCKTRHVYLASKERFQMKNKASEEQAEVVVLRRD